MEHTNRRRPLEPKRPGPSGALELGLKDGKDHKGRTWLAERCKAPDCRGKRITISFSVPDKTWDAVIQGRWNIVCLSCFDEMAQDLGIDYEAEIIKRDTYVRKGDDFWYE